MFFTPGPNNAMLTASGMKFSFENVTTFNWDPFRAYFTNRFNLFGLANLFLIYPQIQFI